MVVTHVIPVVIVIAGTAAAMRLSSARVRRRHKLKKVLTSPISDRTVSPLPSRRPRATTSSARSRPTTTLANVEVLAEYREARASRLRHARVAAAGAQRSPRPHRPEPA